MTGIFIDFVLFDLIQINYRDFLQSPLQVSPVVFAIDSMVPKTNYFLGHGLGYLYCPQNHYQGLSIDEFTEISQKSDILVTNVKVCFWSLRLIFMPP